MSRFDPVSPMIVMYTAAFRCSETAALSQPDVLGVLRPLRTRLVHRATPVSAHPTGLPRRLPPPPPPAAAAAAAVAAAAAAGRFRPFRPTGRQGWLSGSVRAVRAVRRCADPRRSGLHRRRIQQPKLDSARRDIL